MRKNRKLFENSIPSKYPSKHWHISKQFLLGINNLKLLFITLKKIRVGILSVKWIFYSYKCSIRKWERVQEWLLENSTYYNINKKFLVGPISKLEMFITIMKSKRWRFWLWKKCVSDGVGISWNFLEGKDTTVSKTASRFGQKHVKEI